MRTLLLGLDAACERVLSPLCDRGIVPNLDGVFTEGSRGPLESQVPPWTASAWPSLYTGTNPGKHGVFGFLSFDGYDHEVVDATHVRQPSLWELLDHHDLTSVVVNVPVTHPPPSFQGALVPGYTAPDEPECHPEGLLSDLQAELGEYHVYASDEGTDVRDDDRQLSELAEMARLRGRAFRYLADRFDPEFGFVQFQVTDTVCHQFPGEYDALSRVYEAVDDAVGEVLSTCDPDTVVVASDHGIGPYERRVAPNESLRAAGLVTAERGREGMPTWSSIRERDLREDGSESAVTRALAGAASAAARAGLTAQRVRRVLDRIGATEAVLRRAPDGIVRAGSERVAFADSTAYVRSRVECGVRLNVEGREPAGVVSPDDYEDVRERVTSVLRDVETPAGEPVFETVGPREEFFHGPATDEAVDVVALPRSFDSYVTSWLTGQGVERIEGPAWDHKRHGVVALAGDGVDHETAVGDAHLFDVAPTVLASLGVPVAEHMDGTVLPPVEATGTRSYPDRDRAEAATETGEAVEERLSTLGYLE